MILFIAPQNATFGIDDFLTFVGSPLDERVVVRTYDRWLQERRLPVGTYVFAGLDQLTAYERRVASRRWASVSREHPTVRRLNHPERTFLRHELLTAAHARGHNVFRAWRPELAVLGRCRFPVFVRLANEHTGSLTPLLSSPGELRKALLGLWIRGFRQRDLLVVEYCDTQDQAGVFRKYSAFVVGSRIVPCLLMQSPHWMTKHEDRVVTAATVEEELRYVMDNPHETWLRQMFALAHTTYGRIDYGLCGDRPQVWEINLNPTIVIVPDEATRHSAQYRMRDEVRRCAAARLAEALLAVDDGGTRTPTVGCAPSVVELAGLRAARRARRQVAVRRERIAALAQSPPVRWLRRRRAAPV